MGVTVLGGAAYGGAVYYALKDEAFHDTFTTYVPGAEQTVEYVKEWLKKNDDEKSWTAQANEYIAKAQEYGVYAKDMTTSAYEYASDAYQKLTGQKEPPRLKEEEKVVIVAEKQPEAAVLVEAHIEKPDPIVMKRIRSDYAAVSDLSRVLTELASILNDTNLSGKGRSIMKEAEEQLQQLNGSLQALTTEETAILKSLVQLKQQSDKIEAELERFRNDAKSVIQSSHAETARKMEAKEAELQQQFAETRIQMKEAFDRLLAQELDAQRLQLEQERTTALLEQAAELKRRFVREVKLLVEKERAGRLSKLEQIDKRFKALEQQSIRNVEELDKSRQSHMMHVTLDALQDAVVGRAHKRPFVEELKAFENSAKGNALLETVLATIPREVPEEGVESLSELRARFDAVAEQVRRVALVPENGGFGSHIISIVLSKLMFRKEGLVEGNDVEAVLARSGYYLKHGDLENAARELNQLSGWPKRLAHDWIEAARRHLEVKQVLEVSHIQLSKSCFVWMLLMTFHFLLDC